MADLWDTWDEVKDWADECAQLSEKVAGGPDVDENDETGMAGLTGDLEDLEEKIDKYRTLLDQCEDEVQTTKAAFDEGQDALLRIRKMLELGRRQPTGSGRRNR